ncbi:MAG: sigma-54 dependent transcriptional regulator [Pseudomonadota bacterium]
MALILIAEDEQIARENLEHVLRRDGHTVVAVENGMMAIRELEQREFDLVVTDLRMQPVDGMEVLSRAKELYADMEVIVVTGYATVSSAVEAMQKGAYYYISKPYQIDEVRFLMRRAMEKRSLCREVADLRRQADIGKTDTHLLIGSSPSMQVMKGVIRQVAPTDCNILILGETGTGKELVARTIHNLSPRADRRFLAINCGAFNEELLAHELFGHEREAFTGARGIKKGLLESIQGGTILLDEIGDMPLAMQVKLLRVLQERSLLRIGGTQEIPVDIRVLAATNKDLKEEVENGHFRKDLYYRLNVITIPVPRLADRRDDIPALSLHFLKKISETQGKQSAMIAEPVMDILLSYEFPGNVRELENIMERAVTLAGDSTIEVRHLPFDLQSFADRVTRRSQEFLTLEENERNYIGWVMQQVNDNKTKAAEILGIDRVSLWRKLKRYRI